MFEIASSFLLAMTNFALASLTKQTLALRGYYTFDIYVLEKREMERTPNLKVTWANEVDESILNGL